MRTEWLDTTEGEEYRRLLREFKGLETLEYLEGLNLDITDGSVRDALDATAGRLAFASAKKDADVIRICEEELKTIETKSGDRLLSYTIRDKTIPDRI